MYVKVSLTPKHVQPQRSQDDFDGLIEIEIFLKERTRILLFLATIQGHRNQKISLTRSRVINLLDKGQMGLKHGFTTLLVTMVSGSNWSFKMDK